MNFDFHWPSVSETLCLNMLMELQYERLWLKGQS